MPAPAAKPQVALNTKTLGIIGAAVVVVIVVIVVAVSGGGSSNGATDAVNGFVSAVLSNNGEAVCQYFSPSTQSECLAHKSLFTGASGHASVTGSAIQGTQALVSITGELCAPYVSGGSGGNDCASNSDGNLGMPVNGVSFSAAFAAAQNESANALSPVPLEEINGKWYLDAG
jgi:hypothetical protein